MQHHVDFVLWNAQFDHLRLHLFAMDDDAIRQRVRLVAFRELDLVVIQLVHRYNARCVGRLFQPMK